MGVIKAKKGQRFAFVWEHDGRKCPFVHFVDPKLVKSYADYCLIDEDLRQARTCFGLLMSGQISDPTLVQSLLSNGVVTYMRPYTNSDSRSTILDANAVFSKSEKLRAVHEWLDGLRHRLYAHAGGTEYEGTFVCLALHPDMSSGPLEIYRGLVRVSSFESASYEESIEAINTAQDWVKVKIDAAYKRMREALWSRDIKALYAQAVDPNQFGADVVQIVSNVRHEPA